MFKELFEPPLHVTTKQGKKSEYAEDAMFQIPTHRLKDIQDRIKYEVRRKKQESKSGHKCNALNCEEEEISLLRKSKKMLLEWQKQQQQRAKSRKKRRERYDRLTCHVKRVEEMPSLNVMSERYKFPSERDSSNDSFSHFLLSTNVSKSVEEEHRMTVDAMKHSEEWWYMPPKFGTVSKDLRKMDPEPGPHGHQTGYSGSQEDEASLFWYLSCMQVDEKEDEDEVVRYYSCERNEGNENIVEIRKAREHALSLEIIKAAAEFQQKFSLQSSEK